MGISGERDEQGNYTYYVDYENENWVRFEILTSTDVFRVDLTTGMFTDLCEATLSLSGQHDNPEQAEIHRLLWARVKLDDLHRALHDAITEDLKKLGFDD